MNEQQRQQQRDHQTAVTLIDCEINYMIQDLGKPNASSAATSLITLAFMLRVIDEAEHRHYKERIDQIYDSYNASIKQGAAA